MVVLLTTRSSRFRSVQGELRHSLTAEHDWLLRHLYHGGLGLSRRIVGLSPFRRERAVDIK